MEDIVIYGAGGFGREVACLLKDINSQQPTWNLLGFIDDGLAVGTGNNYGKVLGDINFLQEYQQPLNVIIAIAAPALRHKISTAVKNDFIKWPNIIANDVKFIDKDHVTMGKGNLIFYSSRISCDVSIGNFNLMNSFVSFGHDVKAGDCNVFMPNTRISGESVIGNINFFGVNSTMLQGLVMGDNTRVGAGSVIMRNTKDGYLYHGNPAKILPV
jgi:sugar O-acyltransferase (sialic acid O-acetyltransferase NeuD family)